MQVTKSSRYRWINDSTNTHIMRSHQTRVYRTGEALAGHINTQHGGKIDPNCRACSEIVRKMDSTAQTEGK